MKLDTCITYQNIHSGNEARIYEILEFNGKLIIYCKLYPTSSTVYWNFTEEEFKKNYVVAKEEEELK